MKWEYKLLSINNRDFKEGIRKLNELGLDGWEVFRTEVSAEYEYGETESTSGNKTIVEMPRYCDNYFLKRCII